MSQQLPVDLIKIGQIRSPFGLQGWLWVYSHTDPLPNLFDYQPWWVESKSGWRQVVVKRWKKQAKGLVVLLDGVPDRTAADSLVGLDVWVSKQALPVLPDDEFYWSELKGLAVWVEGEHAQSVCLGRIAGLLETGANDVIVVKPTNESYDDQERLLPWHSSVVKKIDMAQKTMTVHWDVDF